MEVKHVYSSVRKLSTEICVSEVKFNFENFQRESVIVSEKISVPDMGAIWWIELRPFGVYKTFETAARPPEMKIVFKFHDPEVISAELITAKINLTETNAANYGIFFKDYKSNINAENIEIDTRSKEYKKSSRMDTNNAYFRHNPYHNPANIWKSLESLSFDCSVVFSRPQLETVESLPKINNVPNRQKMASLLEDGTFSDFTFFVKGKSFKVHKVLLYLASASDIFKAMFTCGLNETKENTAEVDCDPEIFGYFLKFIYTGDLPLQQMPIISYELYELAHLYEIEEMKTSCLRFILDTEITNDNAFKLYKFAATYEIATLLDTSWDYIKIKMLKIFDKCEPRPVETVLDMLEQKKKFDENMKTFLGKRKASENDEQNVTENEIGMPQKKCAKKPRK